VVVQAILDLLLDEEEGVMRSGMGKIVGRNADVSNQFT
jgi:hypothetical protein